MNFLRAELRPLLTLAIPVILAELGWMLNPKKQTVTIFRRDREPEERAGVTEVAGEGPVAGFVLDLRPIWSVE